MRPYAVFWQAKLAQEVEWLIATSKEYPSPVVVAHNDLLPANVMKVQCTPVPAQEHCTCTSPARVAADAAPIRTERR